MKNSEKDIDVLVKVLREEVYDAEIDKEELKDLPVLTQCKQIVRVAGELGWSVNYFSRRLYSVDTGEETLWFNYMSNVPVPAFFSAKHKGLTKATLRKAGISTPNGSSVIKDAGEALKYFRKQKKPQVVKPLRGAEGLGVNVNLSNEKDFLHAVQSVGKLADRGLCQEYFLIEDYFEGRDVRLVVVGDEVVSALVREPASIEGDGERTIQELVAVKNEIRKKSLAKSRIRLSGNAKKALLKQGYTASSVIPKGMRVYLDNRGNTSAGADAITILPYVHSSYLDIALHVKSLFSGMDYIGIDFLIKDFTSPASSENYSVIEVNARPALTGSMFPTHGKPVNVARFLLKEQQRISKSNQSASFSPGVSSPIDYTVDNKSFESGYLNIRLLKESAFRLGMAVHEYSRFYYEVESETGEKAQFYKGISSRLSTASKSLMDSKSFTKKVLEKSGINHPMGRSFDRFSSEEAISYAGYIGFPVVVKPISGRGGKDVFVGIVCEGDLKGKIDEILNKGYERFLLERQVLGRDYRVLVVGGVVKAVAERVPANVLGDGEHTVQELVEAKNKIRASNPYLAKSPILLDEEAKQWLVLQGYDGYNCVPKLGEHVRLKGAANVSSGGDCIDVSDNLHAGFEAIANGVYRNFGFPGHFGLDLMAEDVADSPDGQDWNVIEVNSNPDLGMHHFPSQGSARNIAGEIVKFALKLPADYVPNYCSGEVVFSNMEVASERLVKLWKMGCEHGLEGGVFRLEEGAVKLLIFGASSAVDGFLNKAQNFLNIKLGGFVNKSVSEIKASIMDIEGEELQGFVLRDRVFTSLEKEHREGIYFIAEGRVQGVGFRRWIKRKADEIGVKGWVRNVGSGKVEGVLQGVEVNVENLLKSCGAGPYKAKVEAIYFSHVDEKSHSNFIILASEKESARKPEELQGMYDGSKAAINSIFPAQRKEEKRKEIYNYISAIEYEDLGEKDRHRAKLLLLDAIGLIALASTDRRMEKVREIGLQLGGGDESSAAGIDRKLSSPAAAFVHSAYMQLHDFNDGHRIAAARGGDPHPGRVVVPAALAEAELLKSSGKDLITAIAVGYDVAARVRGRKPNRPKSPQYAAAAVSAKLRKFSTQQIASALGYAGYLSVSGFGIRPSGTDKNFLSKGFQAYAGLQGSRVGGTGQRGPLMDFDEKKTRPFLVSPAGTGFEVSKVYVKPYPTCRMTHSPIAALDNAMNLLEVDHSEIKSIVLKQLPSGMYVAKKRPKPGVNYKRAQFNVYYCLARYAMDRKLGVEQFSKEKCSEREVFEFMKKVEVVKDPGLSKGYPLKKRSASVRVETFDGRSAECQVDLAPGSAEELSEELVMDKFYSNCAGAISRHDAESLCELVMSVENVADVSLLAKKMQSCLGRC